MDEAQGFIGALFPDLRQEHGIQLWHKDDKRSHYFSTVEGAAKHVVGEPDIDIYIAAGISPRNKGVVRKRTAANEVVGVPGVWADIDVNGGPEGKTNAAPDVETARKLAESLLEPTIIVNSGYGVQAWWLFEKPWLFFTVAEREQAARLIIALQATLRQRAKAQGWSIDATHDLARLMRVPGTFNHKGSQPAPVTIIQTDGPRYTYDNLNAVGTESAIAASESVRRSTGEAVGIELRGDRAVPSWRVGQLAAVDTDFKQVWDRRKGGRSKDWSDSEFDLSIATRLADVGCDDQEIADALVHNRLAHGDPKGKSTREKYIKDTIGKARLRADLDEHRRDTDQLREDASDQLEAIAVDGSTDPERTVSLFTQLLGGPEVKELVQDSRDPDQARFRLVLADGREVPIGTGSDLLNADKFRTCFAVVTSYVCPQIKRDKWHKIVQALLNAATVNEEAEDSRSERAAVWLRDYCERGLSNDRNAACAAHDPFLFDGELFIALGPLTHWLRKVRGERMAEADIKQLLIAAGFERRTVNYIRDDGGKKSSRSYWVGDGEVIE